MACPPQPAPAGVVRRLSDLLAEQQEPFSLDAYLLQKGYPERSLPAPPLCWPFLNAAGHGLRRRTSRFPLLKRKLAELLHPKSSSSVDDDNKKTFLWEVERSPVSVLDPPSSDDDDETKDLASSSPACNEPKKLVLDEYEQEEIAGSTRREWYELQPHAREIGAHVEEAIFEDIREAVILEMISSCCTS